MIGLGNVFYFEWEARFLYWLQHLGEGTWVQSFLLLVNNLFSLFGEEVISIAVMGLIYWGIDKEKGKRIGFIIITSLLANDVLKNLVCRVRPYHTLSGVELLRDVDGYAFPSGHSSNAGALYPAIAYEFREKHCKWLTTAAIVLPVLVALSRNYLGAHWPTDVVAGLLQGLLILVVMEFLYSRIKNQKLLYLAVLITAFLGLFFVYSENYYTVFGILLGFVAAAYFEERFIQFENTRKKCFIVLRTIGGCLLFVVLNAVFKAIFQDFFDPGTYGDYIMRTLRYGLSTFVILAVYPFLFRLEKKFK